jgi:cytochrome c5
MIFFLSYRFKITIFLTRYLILYSCAIKIVIAQPVSALSVFDGVYNEQQATQGQALYYQHCLNCHGDYLAGVDKAPPLSGPQFSSTWNNSSLETLVGRIQDMPPGKPENLSREESVEILSYMLWYNGLPIGESSLVTEPSVLSQIKFQSEQVRQ